MDDRTRVALEGSVEKWEKIVAGTGEDEGPSDCALCKTFLCQEGHCKGCPVALRTGMGGCEGSPYEEWDKHWDEHHWDGTVNPHVTPGCPDCERLARAELDFLRSLREPPEVTTP